MFAFSAGNTILQIRGLGAAASGCVLITTLKKTKPSAKIKKLNRVNSIVVNYSDNSASGVGATSLNDGLTSGNFPGNLRVKFFLFFCGVLVALPLKIQIMDD